MRILLYLHSGDPAPWLADLATQFPQAQARSWEPGDTQPADYALVWKPPADVFRVRAGLKAVFNLGAGVDAILRLLHEQPDLLPSDVPLIKLDDAGMAAQMIDYISYAVLRRFRRFDEYAQLQAQSVWRELPAHARDDYVIGIMGMGALGSQVAAALAAQGFPVRGWSRSRKEADGVRCFAGREEMSAFLDGLHVLINMLPLTPDTDGILNRAVFERLTPGAHLINVARGAHLVDEDLLQGLADGRLGYATLDVFRQEPLPPQHPFWRDPRIVISPHVAALTERAASVRQIAGKIRALERGEPVSGVIDRSRGY
jgi:glyoxylate/hydroxypyruvate reductase A